MGRVKNGADIFLNESEIREIMGLYLKTKTDYLKTTTLISEIHDMYSDESLFEPMYRDGMMGCMEAMVKRRQLELQHRDLADEVVEASVNIRKHQKKKTIDISLSPYSAPNLQTLDPVRHFLRFELKPLNVMRLKVVVTPEKYVLLRRKNNSCVPYADKYLLPPEYPDQSCTYRCSLEYLIVIVIYHVRHGYDRLQHKYLGFMNMYKCIPLPLWFEGIRTPGMIVCHSLSNFSRQNAPAEGVSTQNDSYYDCIKERCNEQRPCVYWKMNAQLIPEVRSTLTDTSNTSLLVSLSIPPTMQVNQQFESVTFSSIMGNIGGMMGVYCGISITGLLGSGISLWNWWMRKKSKTHTEIDAEAGKQDHIM